MSPLAGPQQARGLKPIAPAADRSAGTSASDRLTRAAGLVGLLTLASRVLGLLRDAVIAALFPRSGTDAFFVAFTIPNLLRRLLAEGALTVAFIPVYTQHRELGQAQARLLVQSALGAALLALGVAAALGVLSAPWLVRAFAYGLTRQPQTLETLELATLLTRLVLPFVVPVGLTALAMGVLNSQRHFAAPAAGPMMLNLGIIGTAVLSSGWIAARGWPATTALAIGALLGGALQLGLQLPALGSRRLLVLPRLDLGHPGLRQVARLMAPSLFALAIYQITVVLARQFASFLPAGSISFVYYAQRLIEFPIGIFAVALATVSMPELSRQALAGDAERLKHTLRYLLRVGFFALLPATAGLAALALPLCATLFQRGSFDHEMAQRTAATLIGFACGLWAAGGVRQAVQLFYALHDTRTPVKASAISLLAFVGAGLLLFPLGTLGLGLAVSVASTVNFVLLVALLRRRLGPLGLRRLFTPIVKAGLCAAGCGAVARGVSLLGDWTRGGETARNYVVLIAAVSAGVAVYVGLCLLLRVGELGELWRGIRSRGPGGQRSSCGSRPEER